MAVSVGGGVRRTLAGERAVAPPRSENAFRSNSPNPRPPLAVGLPVNATTATDPRPAFTVPDVKPIIAAAQRTGADPLPTAPRQVERRRPFLSAG